MKTKSETLILNQICSHLHSETFSKSETGIIKDVKCGEENRFECNGFLEEWVTHVTGEFQNIRNSIVEGRGELIAYVITYTDDNLKNTARDLVKIKDDKLKGKCFQVCDLHGFFLKKGGFQVNDVPAIKQLVCRES